MSLASTVNYFRELLYRPKRSDPSLMARFYFADLNLNAVAAELDSFDGRKDPERCTCLVNKLRACQDKLLGVCNKMLEEIEPGSAAGAREFRAKFPDDIMTDNLAGQLWFGAECLAAGSSILNKERESDSMRPLARAVTKSLERVRALLREQCLSPQPEYTEKIRENLKIFDRLFADFELAYVQCMVHVKTPKEFDLHQDLVVLFSETLQRGLKQEMISQEDVDLYEPSLMFAVPRLAIVYGLLVSPEGPLNVDRGSSDFPQLFLPFKNLLRKIKELLLTLAPHEVLVLEMLLCQHEEPANISTKLKEVERMLETREKSEEGRAQAEKLQEKLEEEEEEDKEEERRRRRRERHAKRENKEMAKGIVDDLVVRAIEIVTANEKEASDQKTQDEEKEKKKATSSATHYQLHQQSLRRVRRRSGFSSPEVEIDCTDPEIKVTPRRRQVNTSDSNAVGNESPSSSSSSSAMPQKVKVEVTDPATTTQHQAVTEPPKSAEQNGSGEPNSYSPRPRQRLKRHNAKRDSRRLPLRYQKDRRSKFKSTEDLLHRLYVCISGAADQLQSNYAGDFRSILKNVFAINVSRDDEEDEDEPDSHIAKDDDDEELEGEEQETELGRPPPPPQSAPATFGLSLPEHFPVDLATDALQEQMSHSLVTDFLPVENDARRGGAVAAGSSGEEGSNGSGMLHQQALTVAAPTPGPVYAQNLNLQLRQEEEHMTSGAAAAVAIAANSHSDRDFYQSEPTLLGIASGGEQVQDQQQQQQQQQPTDRPRRPRRLATATTPRDLPHESVVPDATFNYPPSPQVLAGAVGGGGGSGRRSVSSPVEVNGSGSLLSPPPWVPDDMAPTCMGCGFQFTMFRRRHHCRNCGRVFCNRCSSHNLALPQFGMERPVRVCNRCHLLHCHDFPDGRGEDDDDEDEEDNSEDGSSGGHNRRRHEHLATSPWARNFGMVS